MCGLFGMVGWGINSTDMRVLNTLGVVNQLRGTDGAGIAAGTTHKKFEDIPLSKVGSDWNYLTLSIPNKEEKEIFNAGNSWFIGHTRWMTKGKISEEASQPFKTEHIIGTHNGTIGGSFEGFFSDSEKLLSSIGERGLKAAVDELYEDDAFALVWFDPKKKTINIYRNSKRTLFWALNSKRDVLYWSSDANMLRFALRHCNIDFETVYACTEHRHYVIHPMKVKANSIKSWSSTLLVPEYKKHPPINMNDDGYWLPPNIRVMQGGKAANDEASNVNDPPWFSQLDPEERAYYREMNYAF